MNSRFASTRRTIGEVAPWPGSPIVLWIVTILVGTLCIAASHTTSPLSS